MLVDVTHDPEQTTEAEPTSGPCPVTAVVINANDLEADTGDVGELLPSHVFSLLLAKDSFPERSLYPRLHVQ